MKRSRYYCYLSSAFELMISTIPLMFYIVMCTVTAYVDNILNKTYITNGVAVISIICVTATADTESTLMLVFLCGTSLISSIKCILCKYLYGCKKVIYHNIMLVLSTVLCLFTFAIFAFAFYMDVYLVLFLGVMVFIVEYISIIINLSCLEQLKYTRGRFDYV